MFDAKDPQGFACWILLDCLLHKSFATGGSRRRGRALAGGGLQANAARPRKRRSTPDVRPGAHDAVQRALVRYSKLKTAERATAQSSRCPCFLKHQGPRKATSPRPIHEAAAHDGGPAQPRGVGEARQACRGRGRDGPCKARLTHDDITPMKFCRAPSIVYLPRHLCCCRRALAIIRQFQKASSPARGEDSSSEPELVFSELAWGGV